MTVSGVYAGDGGEPPPEPSSLPATEETTHGTAMKVLLVGPEGRRLLVNGLNDVTRNMMVNLGGLEVAEGLRKLHLAETDEPYFRRERSYGERIKEETDSADLVALFGSDYADLEPDDLYFKAMKIVEKYPDVPLVNDGFVDFIDFKTILGLHLNGFGRRSTQFAFCSSLFPSHFLVPF